MRLLLIISVPTSLYLVTYSIHIFEKAFPYTYLLHFKRNFSYSRQHKGLICKNHTCFLGYDYEALGCDAAEVKRTGFRKQNKRKCRERDHVKKNLKSKSIDIVILRWRKWI